MADNEAAPSQRSSDDPKLYFAANPKGAEARPRIRLYGLCPCKEKADVEGVFAERQKPGQRHEFKPGELSLCSKCGKLLRTAEDLASFENVSDKEVDELSDKDAEQLAKLAALKREMIRNRLREAGNSLIDKNLDAAFEEDFGGEDEE